MYREFLYFVIKVIWMLMMILKKGSSEIWSDKVSLLHIKGIQRGEYTEVKADNITEVPKAQRAKEL